MRRLVIGSVLGLLFVFCAASTVNPVIVPLQYKTMASPAEFPSAQSCASVSRLEVSDRRNSQILGTRYLQEHPSQKADVTSSGDVSAWLRSGVEAALKQGGVAMKGGGPTLRVTLDTIKTDENVFHRSQYGGRINLTTELVSSSGRSCWKDQVEGYSENYGYAGSAENYRETLNHALDRAMIRMLGSGEFKRAVCNCA